jgi:zinc D-Ala-D-Ala carboxypeptidase
VTLSGPITEHLSWEEATTTEVRAFLAEQNPPPQDIIDNIDRFALEFFEPARALCGPLRVNSLYRCPGLNAYIGGSKTSRHMLGLAADLWPIRIPLREAFERIAASEIHIDQLILEFQRWLHLGAAPEGVTPRRQLLMIFTPGRYEPWDPQDERIKP